MNRNSFSKEGPSDWNLVGWDSDSVCVCSESEIMMWAKLVLELVLGLELGPGLLISSKILFICWVYFVGSFSHGASSFGFGQISSGISLLDIKRSFSIYLM